MDFRQTFQSTNRNEAPAAATAANNDASKKDNKSSRKVPLGVSILSGVVLVGAVFLVVAASVALLGNKSANEEKYVTASAYQAVFLNNGQVYFGKISTLNSRYIDMADVFYLTQNTAAATSSTTSANSDYTLVKLGCQQIHFPKDQMLINREQVTFWENLSDDGKVVKSIKEFKKQNPNNENCSTTTTGTQSTNAGTNATQNSTNTTTNTNTTTGN